MPQTRKKRVHTAAPFRFFTLDEANGSLVYVKKLVRDLIDTMRLVHRHSTRLKDETIAEYREAEQEDLEDAVVSVNNVMAEIREVGVIVEDKDRGIVMFPSMQGDKEIRLIWMYGNTSVRHWVDIDDSEREWRHISTLEEGSQE